MYPVISYDSWALQKPFLVRINGNEEGRGARGEVEGQRVLTILSKKEDGVPFGRDCDCVTVTEQLILLVDLTVAPPEGGEPIGNCHPSNRKRP